MFDIAWSEMVVIGAVALIAIGPKDLPKALRAVGAMTAKARRMAAEFQDHFREAMREAELESVKQEVANLNQDLSAATSGLHSEFNSIGAEMPTPSQPVVASPVEVPKLDAPTPTVVAPAIANPAVVDPVVVDPAAAKPAEVKPAEAKPVGAPAATTLSVEASPASVTVTETAASPVEKPAPKKRAGGAKPKAKINGETLPAGADAPAVQRPKTPRKRAAKALPSGDDRAV
jgi:sec-independent protein translocase protein TatB